VHILVEATISISLQLLKRIDPPSTPLISNPTVSHSQERFKEAIVDNHDTILTSHQLFNDFYSIGHIVLDWNATEEKMSPLPTLDDAASSASSTTENLGDATSAGRQADEAPSRATAKGAELPDQSSEAVPSDTNLTPEQDSLHKVAAHGPAPQADSQDATTAAQPPPRRATTTTQTSALSISLRPKSTHSPQHTISNLKQHGSSLSLPLGGSGSEDIMDLFSPPLSTKTRKYPRVMTVVTAADSVMWDREEVILPIRGDGGLATERVSGFPAFFISYIITGF